MNENSQNRTPRWFALIVVLCMLPGAAFPTLLGLCPDDSPLTALVWFYPFYVIAAGICAWMCYGRRSELAWILIALLLLTHAAIWYSILQ